MQIKMTRLLGNVSVSTVCTGLDRYETLVVGGEHGGLQPGYSTLEEAVAGHEHCVLVVLGLRTWGDRG